MYRERANPAKRWAFVDTRTVRIRLLFTVTDPMSLDSCGDLFRVSHGTPSCPCSRRCAPPLPVQAVTSLDRIQTVCNVGIKVYTEYGELQETPNQVSRAAPERRRVELMYHFLQEGES